MASNPDELERSGVSRGGAGAGGPIAAIATTHGASLRVQGLCELAQRRDTEGLEAYLRTGGVIDELNAIGESAVECLSRIGELEAAAWLFHRGRSGINYYVRGAACGGHADLVRALIAEGASRDEAVRGAARGGHEAFSRALIAEGGSLRGAATAVLGAALGGHEAFGRALIAEFVPLFTGRDATLGLPRALIAKVALKNSAILGAAGGGHEAFARALIAEEGAFFATEDALRRDAAVQGAACGGHEAFARALIADGASENSAACGAALGGHEAFARALIAKGTSLRRNSAIQNAARGGHADFVRALIVEGASRDFAFHGAAHGDHRVLSLQLRGETLRETLEHLGLTTRAALLQFALTYPGPHWTVRFNELASDATLQDFWQGKQGTWFHWAMQTAQRHQEHYQLTPREVVVWLEHGLALTMLHTRILPTQACVIPRIGISYLLTGLRESELNALVDKINATLQAEAATGAGGAAASSEAAAGAGGAAAASSEAAAEGGGGCAATESKRIAAPTPTLALRRGLLIFGRPAAVAPVVAVAPTTGAATPTPASAVPAATRSASTPLAEDMVRRGPSP